jgi:DNA-binding MarR family transcriptional regulator
VRLSLTELGVQTLEGLLPAMSALLDQQMSLLQIDEQVQLEHLLKKVLAGIEQ